MATTLIERIENLTDSGLYCPSSAHVRMVKMVDICGVLVCSECNRPSEEHIVGNLRQREAMGVGIPHIKVLEAVREYRGNIQNGNN